MNTFDIMSPCKDCKTRHEACWDKCEDYQKWLLMLREIALEEKEERIKEKLSQGGAWRWKYKNQR